MTDAGSKKTTFTQGVQSNVDVGNRVVEFSEHHALMIHPVKIVVPFSVLKAIVGNINVHEANLEAQGGINTTMGNPPPTIEA